MDEYICRRVILYTAKERFDSELVIGSLDHTSPSHQEQRGSFAGQWMCGRPTKIGYNNRQAEEYLQIHFAVSSIASVD